MVPRVLHDEELHNCFRHLKRIYPPGSMTVQQWHNRTPAWLIDHA